MERIVGMQQSNLRVKIKILSIDLLFSTTTQTVQLAIHTFAQSLGEITILNKHAPDSILSYPIDRY